MRATRVTVGVAVFHLGVSLFKLLLSASSTYRNRLLLAMKCVKTEEVLQKWIRALGFPQSLLSFRSCISRLRVVVSILKLRVKVSFDISIIGGISTKFPNRRGAAIRPLKSRRCNNSFPVISQQKYAKILSRFFLFCARFENRSFVITMEFRDTFASPRLRQFD
jgi:hypothetical protein